MKGGYSSSESWKPYGMAIRDFYHGDRGAKIAVYNDVAGHEYLTGDQLFRDAYSLETIEEYAVDLCRGHVLDIGAGAGAISLVLKEMGLRVQPLDIAPEAVEIMKLRGLPNARCGNIWEMKDGNYDTLLLMMNGIGLVGDLHGLGRFLDKAHDLLNDNGQVVFDSSDLGNQLHIAGRPEENGYPGEVVYRLKYKNVVGLPYKWLFVDFRTVSVLADQHGWQAQLAFQEQNHYLAKLVRK